MIVRALDINSDWLFGKGKNDYKSGNDAIAQSISTRLKSFLGDCFFAIDQGIDWFNLLGTTNTIELKLAISTMILNTKDVTGIVEVSLSRNSNRQLTITYSVDTVYGLVNNILNQEV